MFAGRRNTGLNRTPVAADDRPMKALLDSLNRWLQGGARPATDAERTLEAARRAALLHP